MASVGDIHVRILIGGEPMPALWRIKVVRFVAELLGVRLEPRGSFLPPTYFTEPSE